MQAPTSYPIPQSIWAEFCDVNLFLTENLDKFSRRYQERYGEDVENADEICEAGSNKGVHYLYLLIYAKRLDQAQVIAEKKKMIKNVMAGSHLDYGSMGMLGLTCLAGSETLQNLVFTKLDFLSTNFKEIAHTLRSLINYTSTECIGHIICRCDELPLNTLIKYGDSRGESFFVAAIYYQRWTVVASLLLKFSMADFEVGLPSKDGVPVTVLDAVFIAKEWDLLALLIEKSAKPYYQLGNKLHNFLLTNFKNIPNEKRARFVRACLKIGMPDSVFRELLLVRDCSGEWKRAVEEYAGIFSTVREFRLVRVLEALFTIPWLKSVQDVAGNTLLHTLVYTLATRSSSEQKHLTFSGSELKRLVQSLRTMEYQKNRYGVRPRAIELTPEVKQELFPVSALQADIERVLFEPEIFKLLQDLFQNKKTFQKDTAINSESISEKDVATKVMITSTEKFLETVIEKIEFLECFGEFEDFTLDVIYEEKIESLCARPLPLTSNVPQAPILPSLFITAHELALLGRLLKNLNILCSHYYHLQRNPAAVEKIVELKLKRSREALREVGMFAGQASQVLSDQNPSDKRQCSGARAPGQSKSSS